MRQSYKNPNPSGALVDKVILENIKAYIKDLGTQKQSKAKLLAVFFS